MFFGQPRVSLQYYHHGFPVSFHLLSFPEIFPFFDHPKRQTLCHYTREPERSLQDGFPLLSLPSQHHCFRPLVAGWQIEGI